ncbi:MAG: hypothetical protein U0R71_12745 [Solirubrobacterales bacterium]
MEALPSVRHTLLAAAICAAALLLFAGRSQAAETIYWNNYSATPSSIALAAPDGSGGGQLSSAGAEINNSEGMAYDRVTNRIYVASEASDKIVAISPNGSGASYFSAPGAPVESPEGVVLDPETRIVYWINSGPESISWARLDGSAGGVVNTMGTPVNAYRLTIDPVGKRLYWFDETLKGVVSVSVDGGIVTALDTTGATPGTESSGIAVEPGLGKVFWLNANGKAVSWASLAGTGGGDIPVSEPALEGGYGLAVDAATNRVYWGNYKAGKTRSNALGVLDLSGPSLPINVTSAPVNGPQDPLLLKSPSASAAPVVTRGAKATAAQLSCSTGTWAADAPGAFVYQSPSSYAYQWLRNGAPLTGAVAPTLTATKPGEYACTVTGTNQEGSASSTSAAAATVKAAKFKLVVKTKKAKAKPGKLATFKLQAQNQGDLKSKSSSICVKLTKAQRQALKAPKCKKLGQVGAAVRKTVKLKIKVKPEAQGTYKIKLVPKGTGGKAVKAKLQVIG